MALALELLKVRFNLCVDLQSLVSGAFEQALSLFNDIFRARQEVKSVDGIVIHPECRLRKIFTLRSLPSEAWEMERVYERGQGLEQSLVKVEGSADVAVHDAGTVGTSIRHY